MPRPRRSVPHLASSLAVLTAIGLYLILPRPLLAGPRWLVPTIEAVLLASLSLVRQFRSSAEEDDIRRLVVGVIAVLNVVNVISVALLVDHLLYGGITRGRSLLYAAVSVWLTNVIVFGLWFWQLDRGGPVARTFGMERHPDFQFPQMIAGDVAAPSWRPQFVDYLYVSLTNAAAFSPTDTMPLTPIAKALMAAESLVSIVTVAVVAGRAVNILP